MSWLRFRCRHSHIFRSGTKLLNYNYITIKAVVFFEKRAASAFVLLSLPNKLMRHFARFLSVHGHAATLGVFFPS